MLTQNTLRNLQKEIHELDVLITDALRPVVAQDKLFESQQDYYDALKAQNKIPQNYYKFQFFDVEYVIFYDLRLKKYFIKENGQKGDVAYDDFYQAKMQFCRKIFDFSQEFLYQDLF